MISSVISAARRPRTANIPADDAGKARQALRRFDEVAVSAENSTSVRS